MYNEAGAIERNVLALLAELAGQGGDWELIVVDDGSLDDSRAIVARLAETRPRLRLVSYAPNRGRGYALRQGFKAARGDLVVTTESDLSWGPEIVTRLIAALRATGRDLVIASPHGPGGGMVNVPRHRVWLSRYGNRLLTLATGQGLTMVSGMTRGYRRRVIDSLYLEQDGKEIHLEIVAQAIALGFSIAEIPAVLRWEEQPPGKPARKSSFRAGSLIWSHLSFTFSQKPFLLLGSVGLGLGIVGLALELYLFTGSLLLGIRAGGRPLLIMATLFVIAGLQVLLFAFTANQVAEQRRLLLQIRNRLMTGRGPGDAEE
jgi:glycosyltransferase involved in cell wall biosynthesis